MRYVRFQSPHVNRRGIQVGVFGLVNKLAKDGPERVEGYLEILAAHLVACERVESTDPGRVIYEDADQVVVVPHSHG